MFNVITLDKGCYKIRWGNPKYLYIDKNSITLKKNFLSTPSLIFALNNLRTEFKISSFDYEKLKKYM